MVACRMQNNSVRLSISFRRDTGSFASLNFCQFPLGIWVVKHEAIRKEGVRMSKKVVVFLCMLLFVAAAFPQTTASIRGSVTDPSGAAVVGAKVTVKNPSSGIERSTTTTSNGDYEVPALPPGNYSVEIQMQGFQSQKAEGVVLAVNQN